MHECDWDFNWVLSVFNIDIKLWLLWDIILDKFWQVYWDYKKCCSYDNDIDKAMKKKILIIDLIILFIKLYFLKSI